MKKAGIIGGIGPESTIDSCKPFYDKSGFPEIIIDSLNLREIVALAESDNWHTVADIISERCSALKTCGADFGVIASNTPHRVFAEIQRNTQLPLISIISETCSYIVKHSIKSVCLLGTAFTMKSDFFTKELQENNIHVVVPNNNEIEYIQEKLMTEIELGIIKETTKREFIRIIQRIEKTSGVEGVLLGCTELPLIIKPGDVHLKYINTTQVHIDAIVKHILEND